MESWEADGGGEEREADGGERKADGGGLYMLYSVVIIT